MNEEKMPTPEKLMKMAKTARLATNEAKNVIMEWAERFDSDEDKIAIATIASVQVAKDMIDAALVLGDEVIKAKTLRQIDDSLTPLVEKLRASVAAQETKH